MAGDWIKMRGNLWDDPRVSAIVDATDSSEAAVVGGLYWLWATADQHTEDGCMPGLTLRQIDRKTGIKGFGDALVSVGWLVDDPQGVVLSNFTEHNGVSAKRRCTDAQRKANVRGLSASDADTLNTRSGQEAPNLGAREEKRREEKSKKTERDRASRLPSDFSLPEDWASFCKTERPDLDPLKTFDKFQDYWTAKAGKDGAKLDWLATWRNWVREERKQTAQPFKQPNAKTFAERDREAGMARWEEMTNRVHPDRIKAQQGQVIDVTPAFLEIEQ